MAANASAIVPPPTIKNPVCIRPSPLQHVDAAHLQRGVEKIGTQLNRNFAFNKHVMTIEEAIQEAGRCLNCNNAPCQTGCPTQVSIPSFNHPLSEGNIYAAAKALFTYNPLGWTSGNLCPTAHYCRGACVLHDTLHGSIHINDLHRAVAEAFMRMKLPQIRNPNIKEEPQHNAKIALIGAGPASLSCATYLARWGYKDITIFEKQSYAGGTPAIEIPEFRMPYHATRFEVKLVEDLGVKFVFNKALGKDFTIDSLKQDGYQAIFIGIGIPEATTVKPLRPALGLPNVYTSKDFLKQVCAASKPGMVSEKVELPNLKGRVAVLGAGDVAADCCQAAFRCGADFVTLVFRRGIIDMRMNDDESAGLKREKVEQLGCHSPKEVVIKDGKAVAVVCELMRKIPGTETYEKDGDQEHTVEFDHLITAFGSNVGEEVFSPVKFNSKWVLDVVRETGACVGVEGVFAGGDCVGSPTIIEGVNDGKLAAWNMNRYLAKLIGNQELPAQPASIPEFMTPVDLVDTSVTIAGLKFPNPFGLASGPSTESALMIRRAFQAGFGWVVAKTFQPDEDLLPNVSPRIAGDSFSNNYANIELNSERKASYWEVELKKLKEQFPNNILIASIHCKGDPAAWAAFAKRIAATGVDALQLNISCPNLGEKGAKPYTEVIKETVEAVHAAVSIPLFPKIGHFQGDIVELARAAKEGGAAGVSGINTMPGIYDITTKGGFIPEVGQGEDAVVAFGGISGRPIRPFALMSTISIHQALPDFPILAAGGAESALSAWKFMQAGASAVQFCSASMYKGQKLLIDECIPGLKFLLYSRTRPYFKQFCDFFHPDNRLLAPKKRFGPYQRQIDAAEIEEALIAPLPPKPVIIEKYVCPSTEATEGKDTKLEEVIGCVTHKVVPFENLDPAIKVISHVDLDICIGCGRCQRACMDAGYSCIGFDKVTRTPKIAPSCHGCGLCVTVCPVHCVTMIPKPGK